MPGDEKDLRKSLKIASNIPWAIHEFAPLNKNGWLPSLLSKGLLRRRGVGGEAFYNS